jgi:hypothetical protein
MKIEKIPTDKLIPYARNAKKHDAAQVSKLAGSIKEFGFNNPVLIDKDNGIIAGHGRVMAAQQLGLAEVPCIRLGHLTDNQRKAYILADNRLAEVNSGWDEELLKLEIADIDWADIKGLSVDDFEFGEIEFGEGEKEGEQSEVDAEPQIDKAEELRAKWGVEPGQLWELGDHRLLCGDSTKKEDVERVMGGERADLCITDPPYGADIQYATHNDTQEALKELIAKFFPLAKRHSKLMALTSGINNVFLYERSDWMLCWFYAAGTGRTPWGFSAWQPVLVWGKDPKLANGEGAHPDGYNWPMSKADAEDRKTISHACPKPVSSWVKWIERLSNKTTTTLYEPFSGSGTTIIACEQLGRKCRAIEISPAYVAVAIQRWADATGKTPRKL